jgi:hypothetical protein
VFAKGLPSAHRRVITQAREAAVAPLVKEISPALLWHFDDAGWNVLGYQYASGRHADYSAGSPDLDRLVQLMEALSAIKVGYTTHAWSLLSGRSGHIGGTSAREPPRSVVSAAFQGRPDLCRVVVQGGT